MLFNGLDKGALALCCLLLGFTRTAAAQEVLFVDTYAPSAVPPQFLIPGVPTVGSLVNGALYEVTVDGVVSPVLSVEWTGRPPGCEGTPDPAVTYPSPVGEGMGPGGTDGLFVFALPASVCGLIPVPGTLPDDLLQLHVSLDNGASFTGLRTLAPSLMYSPSHQYIFTVTGQGQPASFSYSDDFPDNNYGQLRVTVRALPEASNAVPAMPVAMLVLLMFGLGWVGSRGVSNSPTIKAHRE